MRLHFLALAAAAMALSACMGLPLTETPKPAATKSGLTGEQILAVQKEANRHIETCDRTYAWPFAFAIHCGPVSAAAVTAAEVQAMIGRAMADDQAMIVKALADLKAQVAQATTPSPAAPASPTR